jgi:uncharacterized protein YidB (DUF937 family)
MSLLESVVGGLMNNSGQAGSPMQNVLMGLLGGGNQAQSQSPQYQNPQYQNQGYPSQGGGLSGLLGSFAAAGLGHLAQSWVQSGPNQSVSPGQLQSVFGQQRVEQMAQQAGMPQQDFLSQLSQHLPNAVDGMTPNGRLPDEGTVSV